MSSYFSPMVADGPVLLRAAAARGSGGARWVQPPSAARSPSSESGEDSDAAATLGRHRVLLRDAAYGAFYDVFMRSFNALYRAKPVLVQEYIADDTWRVLVSVTLLNKTAGMHAIPVFFSLMERWPTADALARACPHELEGRIRHLGLGKSRTARLIHLSHVYLEDPPVPGLLRPSRCYVHAPQTPASTNGARTPSGLVRQRYPPTCVSHLPGCGPYALDSYRIFCGAQGEWKDVTPRDQELVRYLKWRWAVAELRQWDAVSGPGEALDLKYIQNLTRKLSV